jgi:hypothetical protein
MSEEPGAAYSRAKFTNYTMISVGSVGPIVAGTLDPALSQSELFNRLATNIGTHLAVGGGGTALERGTAYLSQPFVNNKIIFKSLRGESGIYDISINGNQNIQGGRYRRSHRSHRSRRTRRARKTRRSRKQ